MRRERCCFLSILRLVAVNIIVLDLLNLPDSVWDEMVSEITAKLSD